MAGRDATVERICQAALEREPASRATFVAEACGGDQTLRRDVDALLAHATAAERFIEAPALVVAARQFVEGETIRSGTRIGPYEVLSLLGAGGMGEVYRARDANLERDVAIKLLPSLFSRDPDRLARFERESRVLASLNHPNVAAIYAVERLDDRRALVLELVEGPTLADRVAHGPLPLHETLAIAKQIAEALDAAHEKGIVHRDLKPANVKIAPGGIVKVLDFGLAKTTSRESGADADSSNAGTFAVATREGVLLGTAPYMSPEQARGQVVDKRADIWAFGCVLYEMLTGRAAFAGNTVTDTLAAILEREPDWTALPADTPRGLQHLLHRCLEKDARQRWRDSGDVRIELDHVSARSMASASDGTDAKPSASQTPTRLRVAAFGVAIAVVGMALGAGLTRLVRPVSRPAITRTSISTTGSALLSTTAISSPHEVALSPDGTQVLYVGNSGTQLFMRGLDVLEPVPLVTGMGVSSPFVSPDGQWVGFFEGMTLKKVPITGGSPITIVPGDQLRGTGTRGATWAAEDDIIVATNSPSGGLWSVRAAGGVPVPLTQPDRTHGEAQHLWPERLPGGRAILFTITAPSSSPEAAQVAVLDLQTHQQKVLLRGASHAQYLTSGHLVFTAGGALRAVPFDLQRLEVHGTGVQVEPHVLITAQGGGQYAVSDSGTLLYIDAPTSGTSDALRTLVWVDRTGKEEPVAAPTRAYLYPRIAPDQTRVVLDLAVRERGLWIWDIKRATLTPLTIETAVNRAPEWTRDGRRIIFTSDRGGADGLWWQPADGTGTAERLSVSDGTPLASGITPDGTAVIFHERRPGTGVDVMQLSLDGTRRVAPLVQTRFDERNGVVSSDGRWIAFESNRSGQFEVYVRPFPRTDAGEWQVSTGGGTRPLWSRDGKELFYVATTPRSELMSVPVDVVGATWHAGAPVKLFGGYMVTNPNRTYDRAADGRFLMIKAAASGQARSLGLVVVQHWDEEVKARIPRR